ncbi:Aste57867_25306 [Aphanomyces stellatus]|uniref:Aste57867_25306 protein n=1 Tax=Aphanomyces stellatus TaxID=120398 RepID=A0A485LSW4_9STRA|nr:hypothetical protein As57867_025228 [Aphanomyces stellatus]VFU01931.1 Aste57867_25306 [Aphanomyces stellatus]
MDQFTAVRTLRDAIYGKVMLCHRQHRQDECVAIKMMSRPHMAAKTALRSGHQIKEDGDEEFAILQRLAPHPSVLTLVQHFEHEDMLCLVFEFCPHGELFDHLHHHQPSKAVSERQAATWFRQIVDGVQHIHAAGIAHRDLSLENILLDAAWHCRICDFGLSSQQGKWCSGRVGKPFYMAPEVYIGDHQSYNGFKADVWSLGVLLFILLSGIPPLEVPSEVDARFRIIRQEGIHALAKMWKLPLTCDALDLLSSLLRAQPDERPSLADIAAHAWLEDARLDPACPTPSNHIRVA